MNSTPRPYAQPGFTLIELLVILGIIGLLTGLLLPALHHGREKAKQVQCLSNLRQMAIAANAYAADHDGRFPPAYERNVSTGETRTWESFLWDQGAESRIHQCPSFRGAANWDGDRYTGYNYNASYIGGRLLIRNGRPLPASIPSARLSEIRRPARCALFGDGQFRDGANKFMRSPFPGRLDPGGGMALGGTQGFRHLGRSNVAFVDGHVESRRERYTDTAAYGTPANQCGFLSPDNSLYDLE